MAHGKETPRQKMIGMMYLVLTAMLALNVAKEVLDAFTLVDGGSLQPFKILQPRMKAFTASSTSLTNRIPKKWETGKPKLRN
jgi:hypothetical protein